MADDEMHAAQTMLKDTKNHLFIFGIIKTLGIGRTTFYRHFPTKRIEQLKTLQ